VWTPSRDGSKDEVSLTCVLSCSLSTKQLNDDGDNGQNKKYVDSEFRGVVNNKTAYPRA
jgi:hypothetical protein